MLKQIGLENSIMSKNTWQIKLSSPDICDISFNLKNNFLSVAGKAFPP